MGRRANSTGDVVSVNVFVGDACVGSVGFRGGPPAVGDFIDVDHRDDIANALVEGRRWAVLPDGTYKATVWCRRVDAD